MSARPAGEHGEYVGVERRLRPQLRMIFERAYELVYPFFDPQNTWAGHTLEHLAFRNLRESFPQLDAQEVEEIVAAAQQVYVTRHAPEGRHPFKR